MPDRVDTISPRRQQWGMGRGSLSLEVILWVQEWVLRKAYVGLPIGRQLETALNAFLATDEQTHRQTNRQTDRQTEGYGHRLHFLRRGLNNQFINYLLLQKILSYDILIPELTIILRQDLR